MRNLFLFIACLLSLSVLSQEEIVRFQIAFSECHCSWVTADQSYVEWEVWAEPENACGCYRWDMPIEDKPYLTDNYIAREIALNREQTDKHDGDFLLWFSAYRRGIYHIGARNKNTGELMGNTVIRVGRETKGLGDVGVVYYDHDFVLIKARIDDENTTYYAGGCSFDPPASWNPN